MPLDALGQFLGIAHAFCHHNDIVALARGLGQTDAVQHIPMEIVGNLRHESGQRAHGYAGVQGNIAAAAAHDLHNTAPVVGLGGIADAVNHLHGGVQGGVIADGVIGACNVVIDGAGHTDAVNAGVGQITGAPEGTVAADDNNALDALFTAHVGCLFHARRGVELGAAGGVQSRTAVLHDVGHAAHVHLFQITGEQAVVAAHHAVDLHAEI